MVNKVKKKRYVLLYPEVENSFLIKDVGLIPYTLQKENGYEASIACYEKEHFAYTDQELKGLQIWKMADKYCNCVLDGLYFLRNNAKEIDILQLFHPIKRNVLWIMCYLKHNPKGKVYLKLDVDDRIVTSVRGKKDPFHRLKKRMIEWLLTYPDYVTVESTVMSQIIEDYYGIRIPVMVNGYQDPDGEYSYRPEEKEKILLTVARNGTYQKATDILIEAYLDASIPKDWKLRLVGTMEPGFDEKFRDYQEKCRKVGKNLEYIGEIPNRKQLFQEYEKADLFLLPSRFESFGIVLAEALSRGNYLITTDGVPSVHEMIPNDFFGEVVKKGDVEELVHAIRNGISRIDEIREKGQERADYARKTFAWSGIAGKLSRLLEMPPIVLADYICNCDKEGNPVGHPVKVLKELGQTLDDRQTLIMTAAKTLDEVPAEHAVILKYAVSPFQGGLAKLKKLTGRYHNIKRILRMAGRKSIWFCNVDFFLFLFLTLHGRIKNKCYATVYQSSFENEPSGRIKEFFYQHGRKHIQREFVTYPTEDVRRVYLPDYTYLPEKYHELRQIHKEEKVVCLGTMNKRRKLRELVEVFNRIDYPLEMIGFFQDESEYEELKRIAGKNILIRNCYMEEGDYLRQLASAKYSILPYNMDLYKGSSSGVVLESIFVNTIPIAPESLLHQMNVPGIGYQSLDELVAFQDDKQRTELLLNKYHELLKDVYQKTRIKEKLKVMDDEDWRSCKR